MNPEVVVWAPCFAKSVFFKSSLSRPSHGLNQNIPKLLVLPRRGHVDPPVSNLLLACRCVTPVAEHSATAATVTCRCCRMWCQPKTERQGEASEKIRARIQSCLASRAGNGRCPFFVERCSASCRPYQTKI